MRVNSLDTETPEGRLALICTPTESYDVETWDDFTSKFMVSKNLKTVYFTYNLRFRCAGYIEIASL